MQQNLPKRRVHMLMKTGSYCSHNGKNPVSKWDSRRDRFGNGGAERKNFKFARNLSDIPQQLLDFMYKECYNDMCLIISINIMELSIVL